MHKNCILEVSGTHLGSETNKLLFSGIFMGPFCGLGTEMLENGSDGFLGPLCGLGHEMFQNCIMEAS